MVQPGTDSVSWIDCFIPGFGCVSPRHNFRTFALIHGHISGVSRLGMGNPLPGCIVISELGQLRGFSDVAFHHLPLTSDSPGLEPNRRPSKRGEDGMCLLFEVWDQDPFLPLARIRAKKTDHWECGGAGGGNHLTCQAFLCGLPENAKVEGGG